MQVLASGQLAAAEAAILAAGRSERRVQVSIRNGHDSAITVPLVIAGVPLISVALDVGDLMIISPIDLGPSDTILGSDAVGDVADYLITTAERGGPLTIQVYTSEGRLKTAASTVETVNGALTLTSSSASALAVGRQGATSPALKINANTGSSATGIEVVAAAEGGGVAVRAISSGTNESLTIDAKGSGTITLNGTGTGAIALARNTTLAGTLVQTSAAAAALAVGRQGATTPALQVKCDVATCVTGLLVTARAAAAGVDIAVTSSGTDENLVIDAKGAGTITLNGTGTGVIVAGRKLQATAGGIQTKMSIDNVHDTTPTEAELITAFGTAAAAGAGFIGVVKDADGDTNAYLVFSTGAKWCFLKFTVAA